MTELLTQRLRVSNISVRVFNVEAKTKLNGINSKGHRVHECLTKQYSIDVRYKLFVNYILISTNSIYV